MSVMSKALGRRAPNIVVGAVLVGLAVYIGIIAYIVVTHAS